MWAGFPVGHHATVVVAAAYDAESTLILSTNRGSVCPSPCSWAHGVQSDAQGAATATRHACKREPPMQTETSSNNMSMTTSKSALVELQA